MIKLLLLCFVLLFSGAKTFKQERVFAYIEIVEIDNSIFVRTSYNTKVFADECQPKQIVAVNFYKSCVVDTTDIKTKRL